jgi:hypothetical protein
MSKLWISAGAVGFLLLAGWAGNSDYEDALVAEQAYCERVTLYYATAGEQGWPDYRDMYNIMCAKYRGDPELFSNG